MSMMPNSQQLNRCYTKRLQLAIILASHLQRNNNKDNVSGFVCSQPFFAHVHQAGTAVGSLARSSMARPSGCQQAQADAPSDRYVMPKLQCAGEVVEARQQNLLRKYQEAAAYDRAASSLV